MCRLPWTFVVVFCCLFSAQAIYSPMRNENFPDSHLNKAIDEHWSRNAPSKPSQKDFGTSTSFSLDLDEDKKQKIDQLIQDIMDCFNIHGLSFGITSADISQMSYTKAFGTRGVGSNSGDVDEETLFPIGSNTKAFTSFLVGKLHGEGKLDINRPVKDYIGGFALDNNINSEIVTPRDLLTHFTGYPAYGYEFTSVTSKEPLTIAHYINRLRYTASQTSPREQFNYNNIMYTLAGFLAGHVRSQDGEEVDWHQMLQNEVFDVLGMDRTKSNISAIPDFTENYAKPILGDSVEAPLAINDWALSLSPAGGLYSTPTDMLQWIRMFLNKGKHNEQPIVSEDIISLLTSPKASTFPITELLQNVVTKPNGLKASINRVETYGLGWFNGHYDGIRILQHAGTVTGSVAQVTIAPDYGFGIVTMCNQDNANSALISLHYFILDLITGQNQPSLINKDVACAKPPNPPTPSTPPKKSLDRDSSAYLGEYHHPFAGTVKIGAVDSQTLSFTYGRVTADLYSQGNDRFIAFNLTAEITQDFNFFVAPALPIEFSANVFSGDIEWFSIPLQEGVAPIQFSKTGHPSEAIWSPQSIAAPYIPSRQKTDNEKQEWISRGGFAGALIGSMIGASVISAIVGVASVFLYLKIKSSRAPVGDAYMRELD